MMRRLFNKRGQSTLEYLLVLAGIIAALIAFKVTIQKGVRDSLDNAANKIEETTSAALNELKLGN